MSVLNKTYRIVGRSMNGTNVTGYYLQDAQSGNKSSYCTREQLIFMLGRGQIQNAEGQLCNNRVLIRGKGVNLDSLPVRYENTARDAKGTNENSDKVNIVRIIVDSNDNRIIVGYTIVNSRGIMENVDRNTAVELAKQNRLGNARCQVYKGNYIIRGSGVDLGKLPRIKLRDIDKDR